MNIYWKWHRTLDLLASVLVAIILYWVGEHLEIRVFYYAPLEVKGLAANWLGSILSLLGLVSATVAFLFTVIDGAEFSILRRTKSQYQLWEIFAEGLSWLCVASIWCACIAIMRTELVASYVVKTASSALLILVAVSLIKLAWVMTQILEIKIAHAKAGR